MKVSEILGGMHEDPSGTTVIVNGAEALQADAHQYSSLLAGKLNELIDSPPRGGAALVLVGRDLVAPQLLVGGLNGAHRLQLHCSEGVDGNAQYLLGQLKDALIPKGTAVYEGPVGSPSTFFSPVLGPDGIFEGHVILELPIGIEEANFSTAWAQNLVVRGGSFRKVRINRRDGHGCSGIWSAYLGRRVRPGLRIQHQLAPSSEGNVHGSRAGAGTPTARLPSSLPAPRCLSRARN